MKSTMKVLSAIGLAMSLSASLSAVAQEEDDKASKVACIVVDKIVIVDRKYGYDHWYDIKVVQTDFRPTDVTGKLKEHCDKYYNQPPYCSSDKVEIKSVELSIDCFDPHIGK